LRDDVSCLLHGEADQDYGENCLVELYGLDKDSSDQHAFVYVRQLALSLSRRRCAPPSYPLPAGEVEACSAIMVAREGPCVA